MCYTTLRKVRDDCRKVAQVTILEAGVGGGEMALRWGHDDDPRWDDDRRRGFASVAEGGFRTGTPPPREPLSRDRWGGGGGGPGGGPGRSATAGSSATGGSTTSGETRRCCSPSTRGSAARGSARS